MKLCTWVLALALVAGCKKHEDAAPVAPPALGSNQPPVAAPDAGARSAAPIGVLAVDSESPDDPSALAIAFANKIPRLPALSADGKQIARYEYLGGGPMVPQPVSVVLSELPDGPVVDTLPVLTVEEAGTAEAAGSSWSTPDLGKQLHVRAAVARARLRGFRSLEPVTLTASSHADSSFTKLGVLTLDSQTTAEQQLVVQLRHETAGVLHREQIAPYNEGTMPGADGPTPCHYSPMMNSAYKDPIKPQIYLQVGFRYHEECDPAPTRWVSWSLDPADASPVDAIRNIVEQQFDLVGVNSTERDEILTAGTTVIGTGMVTTADDLKLLGVAEHAMDYSGTASTSVQVTLSRDGKTAWASELASVSLLEPNARGRDVPWRASDVVVKTPAGWRIAALAWTEPRGNKQTNRDAKAGTLKAAKLDGDPGDPGLRQAFAKLTTEGVDANASTRADLVAIGSGPGERTVGGAVFAKGWNATWKGKATVVSSIGHLMPSGTTGWVAATITLAKTGYQVPFTVFCVFDKAADGTWSLVHIQFSV